MKFKIFGLALSSIVLLNFSITFAQSYAETALLFSRTRPGGSARILALGGSQIALGGDFSSAASNPAGLGMYNRSEFTFSPALNFQTVSSNYLGTSNEGDRSWLSLPGLSFVRHFPNEGGKFLSSFGITMSRTNDFNREIFYRGNNPDNSIIDWFISEANGDDTEQFDSDVGWEYNTLTGLAYYNYLIGPRSSHPDGGPDDVYFTYAGYPVQQEETITKGGTNQWNIAYAANINDRFFFGGGLGISSLKFMSQKMFGEQFDNPDVIRSMHFTENLEIRGTGVNLTLGAIARAMDFLQIGVSYSTPTFYNLTETYDASMISDWNNYSYWLPNSAPEILNDNSDDPVSTDVITSDYKLRTPSRLSTGIAVISKIGFITADVEFVNYRGAKYSADVSFSDENQDISDLYKNAVNLRLGAEYRYEKLRFRAGFAQQGNTFNNNFNVNNAITSVSGGVGYRHNKFSIDLAVINSVQKKYLYQPYTFPDGSGPVADFKPRTTMGVVTVGFTF